MRFPGLTIGKNQADLVTGNYTRAVIDEDRHEVVSSEDELLILVDENDQQIGTLDKSTCHDGHGMLHRAFSLFVFNQKGETLLQQRHPDKRLWPGYWSNACCSHPRHGETIEDAVVRRAEQELGLSVTPTFVFKFQYREAFRDEGTEFEHCSVFIASGNSQLKINRSEISDWCWMLPSNLEREIEQSEMLLTPWLKLEWKRLHTEFKDCIEHFATP